MKFSEYTYQRPIVKEFEVKFKVLLDGFTSAGSYEEQDAAMTAINKLRSEYDTMHTIASIRHSIDTNDEFRITSYNVCYTKLLRRPFC